VNTSMRTWRFAWESHRACKAHVDSSKVGVAQDETVPLQPDMSTLVFGWKQDG
jgi:hypothetical protein